MGNIGSILKAAVVIGALAVLAGCSTGTYQRGMFQGYVIGSTTEEIASKVGKPDSVDASNPDKPTLSAKVRSFTPAGSKGPRERRNRATMVSTSE